MFDDTDPEIIKSNGQPYFVGWDDHGWFSIVAAEPNVHGDLEIAEWDSVTSLPPRVAHTLAEIIEETHD